MSPRCAEIRKHSAVVLPDSCLLREARISVRVVRKNRSMEPLGGRRSSAKGRRRG